MSEDEQSAEASPKPNPINRWDPASLFSPAHLQRMAAELVIVVAGVVLGMAVTNWNEDRRERRDVARLLDQFQPELAFSIRVDREGATYYGITRHYADVAMAGWANDPKVSDRDFVIAAYQASQVMGNTRNDETWAMMFGGTQLRQIDDLELRKALARVLSQDTESLSWRQLATPYRTNVRRVIPLAIQDAIRAQCGDRSIGGRPAFMLPATCDLNLSADYATAAAALRARPTLIEDLRWHLAEIATYLINLELHRRQIELLSQQIARHNDK
jgi:hypothetical protein